MELPLVKARGQTCQLIAMATGRAHTEEVKLLRILLPILGLAVTAEAMPHLNGSGSDKYSYPTQVISTRGVTALQIVGVKGTLKLHGTGQRKSLRLKVRHSKSSKFEDWHLSVDRRGHTLYFEVFNTAYGAAWRKVVRSELWPEFDIELEGASLPTTVGWHEGQLDFNQWNANLEVSFLRGQVRVSGGHGELNLHPVTAQVEVNDRTGPLNVKGDSGQVVLRRHHGPIELNWLSGNISLAQCEGELKIASRESQVEVRGGSGKLNLQLDKGRAKIAGFSGIVQGLGQESNWVLSAAAPSDVNVKTSSGKVDLAWKNGGAKVFLQSQRGSIQTPRPTFLHSSLQDGHQIVQGTRPGKASGQVFVKTDSGAIQWLQ